MSQTTLAAQPDAAARPGLSTAALKVLGAALMLPDHIHEMFAAAGAPLWLTIPGRLVFPLFLFASAEAFAHTRSRRAYALRLLLASWGMTLLTTLLQAVLPNRDIVLMNNAFSTLFLAALYMQVWDWLAAGVRRRRPALLARGLGLALAALPIAAYSGARGRACKGFFYLYYPAHIVALYLLACAL